MKIVTLLRLADVKAGDYLTPMSYHDEIEMTLVRHAYVTYLENSPIKQINFATAAQRHPLNISVLGTLANILRIFWITLQTARRESADVVYAIYLIPYGLFAIIIAKLMRKPSMITLIGTDVNKDIFEYPFRGFWRWILRKADVITVFDEKARQRLLAIGFSKNQVFTVPHAINMDRYKRQDGAPQDIDVVFVGGFWALKEVGLLIDAWSEVVKARPDAKLALIGDGTLRHDLEAQAKALGLEENIIFTGWRDDIPAWLSRAKIFSNLSNQEGVPTAMLEGMSCGLVPVVTQVGGVPSVIQHNVNGYMVENPADPSIVAEHFLYLLDDANRADYERLRDEAIKVRNQYGYDEVSTYWPPVWARLRELSGIDQR